MMVLRPTTEDGHPGQDRHRVFQSSHRFRAGGGPTADVPLLTRDPSAVDRHRRHKHRGRVSGVDAEMPGLGQQDRDGSLQGKAASAQVQQPHGSGVIDTDDRQPILNCNPRAASTTYQLQDVFETHAGFVHCAYLFRSCLECTPTSSGAGRDRQRSTQGPCRADSVSRAPWAHGDVLERTRWTPAQIARAHPTRNLSPPRQSCRRLPHDTCPSRVR